MNYQIFLFFFFPLLLGAAGAWFVSKWGESLGMVDNSNERSSHRGSIPKGGGIGILIAFFACSLVFSIPKSFWIPIMLISLLSFWGDRYEIRPKTRLLFQFLATAILLAGFLWGKEAEVAVYALMPLLAIFIIGTMNCYNFMDGINGIAGITGAVGFGLLGYLAVVEGANPQIIALCLFLGLACIGFLPFNLPRARTFMGDVGSILLGFVFAGLVVWFSRSFLDFICAVSFLFPFYADAITTLVVRIRDGEKLTKAHRKHFYQLLVNESGIAHWKVSLGYGIVQLMIGAVVLILKPLGILMVLLFLIICFAIFIWFSFGFRKKIKKLVN